MGNLSCNLSAVSSCSGRRLPAESERSRRAFNLAVLSAMCSPLAGLAQTGSGRPIRIIVTAAAGGSDDFQGRLVAQGLADVLGQPCIVENRVGGGGMVGREFVARAAPDGHTLLLAASSLATVPALRPSAKVDVLRDFTPISMISQGLLVLMVHPGIPATSVKELIELAKAKPGKLSFGSSGTGQMPHLSGELFKSMTGVNIVHVPYQGSAPAYVDLMAGRIDMAFGVVASALQLVRGGKVRALAVTGTKRSSVLPEVPTMAEAGMPGFEAPSWMSMFGPVGMSPESVTTLNAAVRKVMAAPEARKRMLDAGLEPETSTPQQLAEQLKNDVARVSKIIRDAGIKIE
jgi:tripartite-type tricarboxylate transporter receptor subunit TctC